MTLSNDTRGWIMTCVSGIACVFGASIICADILIRFIPRFKNFRIQDSDVFLSSSLSLSFGVMLFSALYSMLPSAKNSLQKGGFSAKAAAWTLIGCFLAGVIGIQVLSRFLHHFIPSHVVDCEHTHDEEDQRHNDSAIEDDHVSQQQGRKPRHPRHSRMLPTHGATSRTKSATAADHTSYFSDNAPNEPYEPTRGLDESDTFKTALTRRPSLQSRLTATFSKFTSAPKNSCDADGPCHGFSKPCGQECFKALQARNGIKPKTSSRSLRKPPLSHSTSMPIGKNPSESTPLLRNLDEINEESPERNKINGHQRKSNNDAAVLDPTPVEGEQTDEDNLDFMTENGNGSLTVRKSHSSDTTSIPESRHQHHHHVPTNAFLSIGLQTSIAIALHKLPEGFITFATNHANPKLGFSVFLALFIHNITEGFAMALPLYLAINSRWKAMFWSSLLGGFSQPLGAGVAALWFKVAGKGDNAPGEGVYGCMFALTAGIMASVALQLFSESLDLTHNRNLCMVFAFVGMGILGVSSALTA